tara:strand:- start:5053 stop:5907 length:855 start_codon:yes stop_codon:yes gene_type:complete
MASEADQVATETEGYLIDGFIDAVEGGRIYGWAYDQERPDEIATVTIFHGDKKLGTARADRYREDLANRGAGDGRHAFVFDLPAELRNRPASEFSVFFDQTGLAIKRGPRVFTINQDGTVAGEDKGKEELSDPGEVAHDLSVKLKALNFRLDKIDENYLKLARILSLMDKRLNSETEAMRRQIGKEAADSADQPETADATNKQGLGKLEKYLKVCWRDVKRLRADLESIEVFAMRFDERLNDTAPRNEVETVSQKLTMSKGMATIAIVLSSLAIVFSGYAVFFG